MAANLIHDITCCRCGDLLESVAKDETVPLVKLTKQELEFAHRKYKGPLCIACLNQLKTRYRIVMGVALQ